MLFLILLTKVLGTCTSAEATLGVRIGLREKKKQGKERFLPLFGLQEAPLSWSEIGGFSVNL